MFPLTLKTVLKAAVRTAPQSERDQQGGDQVDSLCQELEKRGFSCWYDQRMENLTKDGMEQGVRASAAVILFLSEGVLARPFVKCWYDNEMGYSNKVLDLVAHISK